MVKHSIPSSGRLTLSSKKIYNTPTNNEATLKGNLLMKILQSINCWQYGRKTLDFTLPET